MQSKEKEKICRQCEGRISLEAETCPFCSAPQEKQQNSFQMPLFETQSLKDSLASLYTPPYQAKSQLEEAAQVQPEQPISTEEPLTSTYRDVSQEPFRDLAAEELAGATAENAQENRKSSLWPTLLLVGGSNFLLLSLMQLFFSKNGILRLEWNASFWFFYLLMALPMLYYGIKQCKNLSNN